MYIRILLLFCFASNALAADLTPFRANYEFRVNGIVVGATVVSLSPDADGHWIYTDETHPTGIGLLLGSNRSRREYSLVSIHEGSPRPLEFQEHDGLRGKTREGLLHFDWKAGVVSGTWNDVPWNAPLQETFHDPLSYQLAIMMDLAKGKRIMNYLIAEDAKIKPYQFRAVAQASIPTLAGPFDTVRVELVQDSDKRYTILWCAPALAYLPVQVEHLDSGNRYAMVLRTIAGMAR